VNNGPLAAAGSPNLRAQGRRLVAVFHAALQAVKLYPPENQTVQNVVRDLHHTASRLFETESSLELRIGGGCFFLNQVRLPLDLGLYAVFDSVERVFTRFEIGGIALHPGVEPEECIKFLSVLAGRIAGVATHADVVAELAALEVRHIAVFPRAGGHATPERTDAAKRVYLRSVLVSREILTGVRLGQAANVRRVKRTVQSIVDQVLNNESALLGMTTLRDFDEYTFTHSVNVCIFCVVFGHKLGLDRHHLYELGLCGLLHDIGKMRISRDVINKPGALSDTEWTQMRKHPALGLLTLFRIHGFTDAPLRQMLAAYEHHMRIDLSGYPRILRSRRPTLYSRIVSVVDTFDAVTSVRSYRSKPWAPDRVLKNMRDDPDWGLDPMLVRAFINATGIYPVGTVVLLTDDSMAVVLQHNVAAPHTPVVRVIADAAGVRVEPPTTLDLAAGTAAVPSLGIFKSIDAAQHGINVASYVVEA